MSHTRTPSPVPTQQGPRGYRVPDTPEARQHAQEAQDLRDELHELGVSAEQVSPSADGRGHVRLNFTQLVALLELIDKRDDLIELLTSKLQALQEKTGIAA